MSNQTNPFSSPLSDDMVKNIDQLNLPIMQKQHIRLLAHCLEIFKEIVKDDKSVFEEDILLREWCSKQSQKFNDEKFNELLYQQMSVAATKLNSFSKSIKKNFKDLNLDDLVILVEQNRTNKMWSDPEEKIYFCGVLNNSR